MIPVRRLVFVALAVSGCSGPVTKPERVTVDPPLKALQISPRFVNFAPLAADGSGNPLAVSYTFPIIQGGISGPPHGTQAWMIADENRMTFELDLGRLAGATSGSAAPLTPEAHESGLRIEPQNTRLFRVGTFVTDSGTGRTIAGEVGFRDSMDGLGLILLFVDRPCVITGAVDSTGEKARLDINFQSAGFHWASYQTADDGTLQLRAHPHTDVALLVVKGH
jgi:hypothetical protein